MEEERLWILWVLLEGEWEVRDHGTSFSGVVKRAKSYLTFCEKCIIGSVPSNIPPEPDGVAVFELLPEDKRQACGHLITQRRITSDGKYIECTECQQKYDIYESDPYSDGGGPGPWEAGRVDYTSGRGEPAVSPAPTEQQ